MKKILILLILLLTLTQLFAHGGGLDSDGGHNNRKTGTYHYHRNPIEKPVYQATEKKSHTVNNNSGLRHNSSCRYYDCYNCYPADSNEGVRACKVCGG
jgi:hypothetical protein